MILQKLQIEMISFLPLRSPSGARKVYIKALKVSDKFTHLVCMDMPGTGLKDTGMEKGKKKKKRKAEFSSPVLLGLDFMWGSHAF